MASLQARHTRDCALGRPWTTFADATGGCTCTNGPMYHLVTRVDGKLVREPVGHNRKNAERALRKLEVAEDEGRYEHVVRNIAFDVWADQWLAGLHGAKPSTIDSYTHTMRYAVRAFGSTPVRRLTVGHVKQFLRVLSEARRTTKASAVQMSDTSRAKHLRVLGVCLESAVRSGYAATNPVRQLPDGERPRKRKTEASPFTDEELPRLFAELRDRGTYRLVSEVALKTGLRQGELIALTWGDVDLTAKTIHVRRTFTNGRLGTPKSGERRSIGIPSDVVELLGAWWGELGGPSDEKLVFPGDATRTGYLNAEVLRRRELYPAMERAGIPREHPTTGEKRTFHSLRHTFARLALENGQSMYWLSKHLGHSSITVTEDAYASFSPDRHAAEVELIVFPEVRS